MNSWLYSVEPLLHDYDVAMSVAEFTAAFDVVFGLFVVAVLTLTVLTVRFVIRRDRERRR
jgi:hypothetical protein